MLGEEKNKWRGVFWGILNLFLDHPAQADKSHMPRDYEQSADYIQIIGTAMFPTILIRMQGYRFLNKIWVDGKNIRFFR